MPITYDPSNNTITVVGYTEDTPCTFDDIYNADKAGTLSLVGRDGITAVDTDPVNNTYNLRPADEKLMGGAKNDLYITIANWDGTTATIRLIGTDENDAALTEDIVVTANGTYYATDLFKTLTQTQVTAFTGTSFDYELVQGQWGVVSKLSDNQFRLNCLLYIGDGSTTTWFADINKQIVFPHGIANSGDFKLIILKNLAHFRLGELVSGNKTKNGCMLTFEETTYNQMLDAQATSYLELYSCLIQVFKDFYFTERAETFSSYITEKNCIFDGGGHQVYWGSGCNLSFYNILGYDHGTAIGGSPTLSDRCTLYDSSAFFLPNYPPSTYTLKNPYGRGNDYVSYMAWGKTANIINGDFDNWTFNWLQESTCYRKYEFALKVIDKDENAISGATVKVWDLGDNLVLDTVTNADGYVGKDYGTATGGSATTLQDTSKSWTTDEWKMYEVHITGGTGAGQKQTVVSNTADTLTVSGWTTQPDATSRYVLTPILNYGYYNQAGGDTPTMQTPHTIEISKAGYQTYRTEFTVDEKIDWQIRLKPIQINIDNEVVA